ncbi:MAG: hypothetical protein BWY88_00546 [Synergistetes bacterium ADurb.Bin520]|nr:MAG: hypothetical protein BWY88_00546 [Synergistetes bacterium ADurb.Bin520]
MVRGAVRLSSSRRTNWSSSTSTTLSALATPISAQKRRRAAGVYPRRRNPEMVGMRGSSHPLTTFEVTSSRSLRLLMRV